MNRLRLATWATLAGVSLAAGCANPCGGCRPSLFERMSMFRSRGVCCPCETCGCGGCGGGVPIVGAGPVMSDGPILGEPHGGVFPPSGALPPAGAVPPGPPLMQSGPPSPLPPNLGAPIGPPAVPAPDGRISPIPNPAQTVPAEPSSRLRR